MFSDVDRRTPGRTTPGRLELCRFSFHFGAVLNALVRFVAPALVIVVLLQKVGILDADELFHGLFAG